jgi:hypothetical protein
MKLATPSSAEVKNEWSYTSIEMINQPGETISLSLIPTGIVKDDCAIDQAVSTGFILRKIGFNTRLRYLRFVVEKVALELVILRVSSIFPC